MHDIASVGWVPIAHLLRPQGRRGELLAEPLSDLPGIFSGLRELFLAPVGTPVPPVNAQPIHIQEHWFPTGKNAGRIVLKISGCESISDAEAIAGLHLLLAADQLPPLAPDTFFVGDLVGCTLHNNGTPLGTITAVEFPVGPDGRTRLEDAAPLLAVLLTPNASPSDASKPESILVPFVRAWLDDVDLSQRCITMRLPSGLIDMPESTDTP